ncbi:MAG: ABC transporter permease, partial [Phycisphaerae bacterium]|nr:ABC transporter permease [Phycisphaerae bacterium]
IRVEKPSALPRDAPLSKEEDSSVAFRVVVKGIVGDESFGRFSLQANQIAPYNVYVPMKLLQERVGLSGRVNTLLVGGAPSVAGAQEAFRRWWTLADAELELRALADRGVLEVRSSRVFIDPPAAAAALEAAPGATGILTYFVNEIHAGVRSTPYSIVTAMGPASTEGGAAGGIVPPDMADDEILLSAWLAEDLEAKPGDAVYLNYFVAGTMRQLHQKSSEFTVRGILAAEGPWSDPTLMPEFPGLSDAENCRDWKAGIPIDFKKIREKDEDYWDKYRGTPKAFVTLKAGRRMWSNRFGDLTALRWPAAGEQGAEKLADGIRRRLAPESLGLYFRPVREEALRASREGIDFGQLFLGLSFFLVVAAVLLMSLLFVFGIEQRREEIGTLLALGFSPARVRHLLVAEGGVLALLGGAIGVVGGIAYTRTVLYGLSTVWQGAVSTSALRYYAEPATLVTGFGISVVVALMAMWLSLRKQAAAPARELLAAGAGTGLSLSSPAKVTPKPGLWIAAVAVLCAVGILALAGAGRDRAAAGAFFVTGLLLLIGGLGLSH